MRQSEKETGLKRMMRAGMNPDLREAKAFTEMTNTEFAEDWNGTQASSTRNGRRHSPGGRG